MGDKQLLLNRLKTIEGHVRESSAWSTTMPTVWIF